ncbi:hypothetical protein [Amycolatopsis kentuckyensis]|uniref:hypothetical protein n=1 Tax=Amycolatopsis kentuckyensis TaxID=218823 RepID=UPI003564B81B
MSASITERLHEHLHKLPGMPAHSEAGHRHRHANPKRRHTRPPRVLVGWQNWIAGLVAGRGDRR